MFFALGFNCYRVQGDGLWSYAFLENILHIPDPESDIMRLADIKFNQCGNAFFNAPFYLLGYALEKLLFFKHWEINGITLRTIFINLASNFYLSLSLILCIRMVKKLNFRYTVLPPVCILFSTTAFSAAVVIPSLNHAADIFINTVFLFFLLEIILETKGDRPLRFLFLALVYTIAILVRYANVVLILPLFVYFLVWKEFKKIRYLLISLFLVIWIVPLLIQVFNRSISPAVTSGFTVAEIFKMALAPKYLLKFLVHPLHGLFIWSPVTFFSLLGLFKFPKSKEGLGYLFLGIWVSFLLILGSFYSWYGGWSFSSRYLIGLFPVYTIGLSALLEHYGRKIILPVIAATFYSIILFLNWHLCIMNPEFATPWEMVRAWAKGESETFLDKKVTLPVFLHRLYEFCRYKYILKIF